MNPTRTALCSLTFCALALSQQQRWQVPATAPSTTENYWMGPYIDHDGDGARDFLRLVFISPGVYLEIASGLDGSTLLQHTHPLGFVAAIAQHAGDVDRDGHPDLAIVRGGISGSRRLEMYSPSLDTALWTTFGTHSAGYGTSLLANIDVNGDGRPDVITTTLSFNEADVYVYDSTGALLYVVPCLAKARFPISLAKMGDVDGDGGDDFLIGCNDASDRGLQWLISGRTGNPIRETYGLLPGDRTSDHISNLGDIDGDGVDDYAAWPYFSAARLIAVAYSGATGAVIRSWPDYANSVVTGEDFDQDGVNDYVSGADWVVQTNVAGIAWCHSGRDGSELWRVANTPAPNITGNSSPNWMLYSAGLGPQPGSPYPSIAWLNRNMALVGTFPGLARAYAGTRAGQGPVTGTACTSSGTLPLIGVRKLGVGTANTGSRITVARTHAHALAVLCLDFSPRVTPIDLASLGFASCTLYVDPIATFLQVTGTTGIDRGYAATDLPHLLSATAVGTDAVAQWLVFDPATVAYAATQMHAIRLQ
jgi:hypothetical protein